MGITITKRPDKEVSSGYDSRWLAINGGYPVFFTLYRKDFALASVEDDGNGFTALHIAANITTQIAAGQKIYFLSAAMGQFVATITNFSYVSSETVIQTNHIFTAGATDSDAGNYCNLLGRDDYKMRIQVYGLDNNELLFEGKYSPTPAGRFDFDVSGAITPYISLDISEDYPAIREADTDTTQPFYIRYAEYYGGVQYSGTADPYFYRGVNAANQVRDPYAENMGNRVAFNADITPKAKWLSDFLQPTYFKGYPFSLTAIVETNGTAPEIRRWEEKFAANGTSAGLENATYPTGSDFSRPQINGTYLATYASSVAEVDIWLESDLSGDPCTTLAALTQPQKWSFQQPQFDVNTNELLAIYIEFNPLSGISALTTHPDITVTDGVNVWAYQWNAAQGYWDAVAGPNYLALGATYTFTIASIGVTMFGQACTTSFVQPYTHGNAGGGAYDSEAYSSGYDI